MAGNKSVSGTLVPRDGKGRFLPGQSGNPGGRPRGLAKLVREQTDDGKKASGTGGSTSGSLAFFSAGAKPSTSST